MTVGAGISVSDGRLNVLGQTILSDVKDNVIVTPASGGLLTNGAFIGVQSDQIGSRRVFPIGKLRFLLLLSRLKPFNLLVLPCVGGVRIWADIISKNCYSVYNLANDDI